MYRHEQFQDFISRLYPKYDVDERGFASNIPRPITFCVTNACQLRCTYCYEQHKGNSFMEFETAKKFIDLILAGEKGLDQYISPDNSPAVVLEFIGGEPFLAIDLIDQITDYWLDRTTELMHPWADKTMVSICSNGVAYFEPKVQEYLEKNKDRLSFSVTLDGNRELHNACRVYAGTNVGCYDEAVAACNDWMGRGNYMGSKITLAPQNLEYMYDAVMHMVDLGYDEILGNCAYEPEYTADDARIFYDQGVALADEFLRRGLDFDHKFYCSLFEEDMFKPKMEEDLQNWCGGNGVMISCDWDGRIYPCIRYMEMALGNDQPPLVIGNVDDGILQTDEQREIQRCLTCIDRRTQSDDECFYCPIAEGCSWCTAWNYQLYGTPDKRCKNICIMHKARALFNCYFWNRYYRLTGSEKRMALNVPDDWALEIVSKGELDMLKDLAKETENEIENQRQDRRPDFEVDLSDVQPREQLRGQDDCDVL